MARKFTKELAKAKKSISQGLAMARKSLRGTKITVNWWDKQPDDREGKNCEITKPGSMRDVKECAQVCGSHFFEKATMKFFSSRVGDYAYADGKGGAYFTTSEKGPYGPRAYTVRRYDPKRCGVETVGKFQGYDSSEKARAEAKRLAKDNGLGRRK
jgi:hypothetical protein